VIVHTSSPLRSPAHFIASSSYPRLLSSSLLLCDIFTFLPFLRRGERQAVRVCRDPARRIASLLFLLLSDPAHSRAPQKKRKGKTIKQFLLFFTVVIVHTSSPIHRRARFIASPFSILPLLFVFDFLTFLPFLRRGSAGVS
jgi:hypothetical protein